MKFMNLKKFVLPAAGFLAASTGAFAAGPDYSALAGSVDATTIVVGITAIAGVMILPDVAKWGYRKVMSFIRG